MKRFFLFLLLLTACSGKATKRDTPYVIVRPMNWQYLNLYGAEKNVSGFSDDLMYQIAKAEDFQVRILSADVATIISSLNNDRVDGVLTALPPTDENSRLFLFSEPYFQSGPVLLVRKDSSYRSLKALAGREIGFETGYLGVMQLKGAGENIFRPYSDISLAINDLLANHIDAVAIDAVEGYRYVNGPYRAQLIVGTKPLTSIGIRLVVKKEGKATELIPLFNKGLEETKKAGLYQKILRYWALFDVNNPESAHSTSPADF